MAARKAGHVVEQHRLVADAALIDVDDAADLLLALGALDVLQFARGAQLRDPGAQVLARIRCRFLCCASFDRRVHLIPVITGLDPVIHVEVRLPRTGGRFSITLPQHGLPAKTSEATVSFGRLGPAMTIGNHISSTSRSVLQPQQQIMTFSLVACSSSLSTESWWIGDAGNDLGLAGAANAEFAGIVDVDAGLEQHFEDFLAFGDEIFLAGTRELDPEAAELRRRFPLPWA